MNLADTAERLFWTAVAAFGGSLIGAPVADALPAVDLSVTALDAALLAAVTAVVNFVLLVARERLAVLPDPGEGLTKN